MTYRIQTPEAAANRLKSLIWLEYRARMMDEQAAYEELIAISPETERRAMRFNWFIIDSMTEKDGYRKPDTAAILWDYPIYMGFIDESQPGGGGGGDLEWDCRVTGHVYGNNNVCIWCNAERPLFGAHDIPDGAGDPVATDDDDLNHCIGCDREIEHDAPLNRCPACYVAYITSGFYLHAYADAIRKSGLKPEAITDPRYTALPMPPLGTRAPAYITAGDAADWNERRQRAGINVYLRSMRVLSATRFGAGVLLLCGEHYPINYFVVDPATKLEAAASVIERDPDGTPAPVFPVGYTATLDALLIRSAGTPALDGNNGVIPLTVWVNFYDADAFKIGAVKLYWTDRRRMKRYTSADHVWESDLTPAGIRADVRARLHMEDRIMLLAKAPAGW